MAIACRKAGICARSNTGSGQISAQVPQKVHSPGVKSSRRPLSESEIMPVGQPATQSPQPVQASAPDGVTQGGSDRNGSRRIGTERKRRRGSEEHTSELQSLMRIP